MNKSYNEIDRVDVKCIYCGKILTVRKNESYKAHCGYGTKCFEKVEEEKRIEALKTENLKAFLKIKKFESNSHDTNYKLKHKEIEMEVDFYDYMMYVFDRKNNFRYKESFKNYTFRIEFEEAYRFFLERCKND